MDWDYARNPCLLSEGEDGVDLQCCCCDAPMYLLVLIILGLVSLAVIWQIHEYQKRADAREKEAEKADNNFSS